MSTLSVRRPLVLLAVLGMVATLLFAVAGTASAATTPPANEALFSACPGSADIPDPGFTDTAGFAKDDIDCIAYYGVTTGSTPTTYDPGANVSRHQMALFLARMAGPSGLPLDPTPPDAGFTDIGHLPAATQLAINQLVEAGIVKGTTATTYSPAAPVLRQHMALFLSRFADPANGVTPGPGNGGEPSDTGAPFTDIDGVSVEAHVAINHVYNLGVTTGKTATTYDPMGLVHRDQMAAFMARLMGQTNARPIGVNIQANPMVIEGIDPGPMSVPQGYYSVTARNADFSPDVNVHVDAFSFDADKATDTPFKTDGTCDLDNEYLSTLIPGYVDHADLCKVSINDGVTNTNGNITSEGDAAIGYIGIGSPFTTFYAWTGAIGAMFDVDTTTYSSVVIVGVPAPPTLDGARLDIDDDWIRVPFGTAVTWSVQLVDSDEEALALAGVDVTFTDTWDDDYDDDPIVPADSGVITKVVKTDASGVATYTVTESKIADDRQARHVVSATFDKSGTPVTATNSPYTSIWSDVAPVPYELSLSTPTDYKVINETGTTPNSVTATVVDQYGDRYTGPGQVKFWSDVSDGLGGSETVPALTLNLVDGKATTNYVLEAGADSNIEVLQAAFVSKPLTHDDNYVFFWVDEGVAGDMYEGEIFWTDMDANELIIVSVESSGTEPLAFSEDGIFLLTWKADDRYLVEGVPSTMAEFETFIDEVFGRGFPWAIVNKYLDPADDGKTSWNVDEDDEIPG